VAPGMEDGDDDVRGPASVFDDPIMTPGAWKKQTTLLDFLQQIIHLK